MASEGRLAEEMWSRIGGVSVRTKILGIVLTLTILLGLGITWQVRAAMNQVFFDELDRRGLSVASDLAARSTDPILLNDIYALHQLLTDTVTVHPDVLYAFLIDADGQIIAHTFGETGFPGELLSLERRSTTSMPENAVHVATFSSDEGIVHEFAAPIWGNGLGTAHLGLTETRLHGVVNGVTGQMLLTTLAVSLVGVFAAMLLTWLLTQPILHLVEMTKQVGQGNLLAHAPHWADDEIGALADAFNQMVADLRIGRQAISEKEAARTRLLEQLITAQEEERKRIARELHDGVGQSLTSLLLGMKLACQVDDVEMMRQKSEEMRIFASNTLEDVRLLSRQLRPSVLDDLGLQAALQRYATEFGLQHPHITVDLHCNLSTRLPATTEITLYRIIQEAMTNAARHAGGHTVSVLLSARNGRVQVIIEDDGIGFDPDKVRRASGSVGIHGMIERAELVGGWLDVESGTDGTTVYVDIPQE